MRTPLSISGAGLDLLKAFEAFSLDIYPDQFGRPTIYWGHLVRPGDRFNHTREEGDTVLLSDLGWAEACINAYVQIDIAQREFDALVVLCFNIGALAFQGSTLRRLLNAGDRQGAADQFMRWDMAHDAKTGRLLESDGLRKRRAAERALFLGLPWSPP
jgi:lysozyme